MKKIIINLSIKSPIKSHIVEDSQVLGPSGIRVKTLSSKTKTSKPEDHSNSEDEVLEESKCIVCKKSSPDWKKRPYVIMLNWDQCDLCEGWVHLTFCTPGRDLRRSDSFMYLTCESESHSN